MFSSAVSAVEYVTLFGQLNNPDEKLNRTTVNVTDLVEVQSCVLSRQNGIGSVSMYHSSADKWVTLKLTNENLAVGSIFTGIENISTDNSISSLTLKITKASERNKVGPTSVLVLPENATGNYDLIVESSSDSVTWTPFHSQAVQSDTVKRLFRVRIVHKGQEEAKAKAKKN